VLGRETFNLNRYSDAPWAGLVLTDDLELEREKNVCNRNKDITLTTIRILKKLMYVTGWEYLVLQSPNVLCRDCSPKLQSIR